MTHQPDPAARPLSAAEVAAVRADFPYLERPARNGESLAYLDWAATSQKPSRVMEKEAEEIGEESEKVSERSRFNGRI